MPIVKSILDKQAVRWYNGNVIEGEALATRKDREMTNLNPTHEVNAREVEMMVGKATCAYANWQDWLKRVWASERDNNYVDPSLQAAKCKSEYETTIRILDFFVEESLYEIQHVIVTEAEAMMAV